MSDYKMSDKRNLLDQKRRLLAENYELRRKLYKALSKDTDLPIDICEKNRCKLADLPRNSSFTRVMNRCVFPGRAPFIKGFMFRVSFFVIWLLEVCYGEQSFVVLVLNRE